MGLKNNTKQKKLLFWLFIDISIKNHHLKQKISVGNPTEIFIIVIIISCPLQCGDVSK